VLLLLATATLVSGLQPTFFNSSVKPPKEHHKFLFLLPMFYPSHVMTAAPLMVALASRGHEGTGTYRVEVRVELEPEHFLLVCMVFEFHPVRRQDGWFLVLC
ncbi:hypothetical protein FHG87_021488, partial [Trinorchestia longiramus]